VIALSPDCQATADDRRASFPDAGRIIAFRNILIHGYADVDDRLVWNIVETKLPTLIREVAELIASDSKPRE
jgi:uncharacterized protein with HEPN domain